jgi:hypothetical protein
MPAKTKIEVGKEVEAYCGKCKSDMIHVITSIKDTKIDKVMCKGCNNTHKFKSPESAKAEKAAKAKKQPAKKKSVGRRKKNDWATLIANIEQNNVIDYTIKNEYNELDAINHKNFGLGVITKVLDDKKIEVVFEENTKILAQNWE